MDTYQQIAELAAELHNARLTNAERQATVRQLHELQHDIELAEIDAVDHGDGAMAEALFQQWSSIEQALTA
jgi:hypothetical protein